MSEIESSVRKLKHDYAEQFAKIIVKPAKDLLKECLSNPESFDDRQKRRILRAYENAIKLENTFELLGNPFETQIGTFKDYVSLLTDDNVALYQAVLQEKINNQGERPFRSNTLVETLQYAANNTDEFCDKLNGMDHYEFEKADSFKLSREVEDAFRDDLNYCGITGKVTYRITRDFDRTIDDSVNVNLTAFKDHVIGNIIKNIHEHAFIEQSRYDYEVHLATRRIGEHIELIIANNGVPFHGDVDKVFNEGVGEGTGIGLYSAKQCLEHYDCTIRMVANENEKYHVCFIISFPNTK